MRIRTGLALVICCCAGLTACTASAPRGPQTTVAAPSVGRPQPPSSVQAALSREPFTPYAALGQSDNDGLAPDESDFALAQSCVTAAGYPDTPAATSRSVSASDPRTWPSPSPGGSGATSAPPRRGSTASAFPPVPR